MSSICFFPESHDEMKANHIYIYELQLQSAPRHRAGIIGIERAIQKKQEDTDKNISQAFEDLSNLMEKVCSSFSSFNFNICLFCR